MTEDNVRTIQARDGVRLAVHQRGSGPPLLCVPGGPGRASAYLEDLGGLGDTHTLHLLDNRGTGLSELPDDRSSLQLDRLPDDLEDVRQALSLDPADILAHSAGCPVALLHAARPGAAVGRLVLVTPSGRPFGWETEDLEPIRRQRADEPWYAEAAEAQAAMEHANPRMRALLESETRPFWYGRWDDRTKAHAAGADQQMSLRANAGYAPGPDYDAAAAQAALAGVTAQVLVVVGGRDALTGVAVAERFADVIPDVTVARIDAAGHFPWVDEAEEFSSVLTAFLHRDA